MKSMGFSLIELMVVMAIISILTALAIPSYRHYTEKARFIEVIVATQPYKMAVAIALQTGAPLTGLNSETNNIPSSPNPTKHLSSIQVRDGVIVATASEQLSSATYQLTPNSDGTNWTVSGTCIDTGLCNAG